MKNTIKERLESCPCLKSRRSAFLTGAAVVAGGLLVAHKHEAELRVVFDLVVDGQNRAARNAEDVLDAEVLQRTIQRLGASHLLAIDDGLLIGGRVDFRYTAECLQRRG